MFNLPTPLLGDSGALWGASKALNYVSLVKSGSHDAGGRAAGRSPSIQHSESSPRLRKTIETV